MVLPVSPGGECSKVATAAKVCSAATAIGSAITAGAVAFDPGSVEAATAAWFGVGALTTQHSLLAPLPSCHALSCFMQHGCGDDVTAPKHNAVGISTAASTASAATIRMYVRRRICSSSIPVYEHASVIAITPERVTTSTSIPPLPPTSAASAPPPRPVLRRESPRFRSSCTRPCSCPGTRTNSSKEHWS